MTILAFSRLFYKTDGTQAYFVDVMGMDAPLELWKQSKSHSKAYDAGGGGGCSPPRISQIAIFGPKQM